VVGSDPCAVGRQCPLPLKKLLALVEPIEGVGGTIIGGELQLGVAGRLLDGRRGDEGMDLRGRGE
jgi:hypothetical protein